MASLSGAFTQIENKLHGVLVHHSIALLRVAVGAVFLGFGVLKFFPGVSPAEDLVVWTTDILSFGLVPGGVAIVAVAILECFIGVCLLAQRWMRLAVWLLAIQLIGILAPLVLLTSRLFSGPSDAPTLAGQYVLKDFVLVAAGMVIAAGAFRGGRLVRDETQPGEPQPQGASASGEPASLDASRKLQIVLSATGGARPVPEVCAEHGISQAAYYTWRGATIHGATRALDERTSSG